MNTNHRILPPMQLPDTTTVANRIGRIALASILAALLASTANLFAETLDLNGYVGHSVTEPLELYFAYIGSAAELFVGISVILAVALPVYWLLTRRLDPEQVLVPAFVVAAAVAIIAAYIGSSTPYQQFVGTVGGIGMISAVFIAVAGVEAVSESGNFDAVSLRRGITTMGGIVVFSLVLVFVTVGAVNLGVAAADAVGAGPDEPSEDSGMSPAAFQAEYGSLTAAETGENLTCSENHLKGTEPALPASETHWNNLSAWNANVTIETGLDEQTRDLEINLSSRDAGRLTLVNVHEHDGNHSMVTTYSEGLLGFEETSFEFRGAASHDSLTNDAREFDDLALDMYAVNDDGEVVRYTGNLCS